MSNSVDLRGFVYQLEPVQKLATWKLDALHQKLANAQIAFTECEVSLHRLKLNYVEKTAQVKSAWLCDLNIINHAQSLHYLQSLKALIEQKLQELHKLHKILDEIREACVEQQMKLELIESHRESSIVDYQLEQQNILSAEADRDWNARAQWRAQQGDNKV